MNRGFFHSFHSEKKTPQNNFSCQNLDYKKAVKEIFFSNSDDIVR